MKRLVILTIVVGPSQPPWPRRSARRTDPRRRLAGEAAAEAEAPGSARGGQGPRQVADWSQVRHTAVRLAGHERQEPRLRRRGRAPVREVGVRLDQQGRLHVCHDREPHRHAHVGARRHHHVDGDREGHRPRFVLQRGRAAARQNNITINKLATWMREEARVHVGLDLTVGSRTASERVQVVSARRRVLAVRTTRPTRYTTTRSSSAWRRTTAPEAELEHLPQGPVGRRHPQERGGHEALGGRGNPRDEEPRHVLVDPQAHDPAALLEGLQAQCTEPDPQAPVPTRGSSREQLP